MRAWEVLDEATYTRVWDRFEAAFAFRPSVEPAEWPGVREPTPSVTYAIGHIYGEPEARATALEADLEAALLAAFRALSPASGSDAFVYALDWQHPAYRFHVHSSQAAAEEWRVPALPNGDYYIFLAPDFRWGVFGHPWEQTMCVFGAELLAALAHRAPRLFGQPVRQRTGEDLARL